MSHKNPKLWIMKITPGGSGNTKTYFENLFINQDSKKLIGYTKEEGDKIEEFSNLWKRIKIGDLIVVIEGFNRVFGVVEITSNHFDDVNKEGDSKSDWFYHRRKAALVKYFNPHITAKSNTNRNTIIEYSGEGARDICDMVWNKIKDEYWKEKEFKNMKDKIELLEYKKQIILQGPPGTGKTRLAKLIAEEMTSTSKVLNPMELIDGFLKNFDTKSTEVLTSRTRHKELLNEFQSKFPIASLKDISKENYCIGTGSNNSFCWWIERGLISLGYYFPGSARSYLIFWSKSKNEYSKHGLATKIEDDDEAAKRIGLLIADLLEDKNVKVATTFLGTSFLLKILHSYYPEKYFPVNSIPCLENILKLFGENYSSLNGFDKNLKVQELFTERKKALGSDVTSIEFMQFLFRNFDLKGKIEIKTNQIISRGEYKIIQFHPSYSYEDFVRGIAAKTNSDNKVYYKVEDRILMEFAKEALDNSKSKYVLILDEINRANLSSVLGELIYALEYRYNHTENNLKEASVESLYDISEDDGESNRILLLPDNLYIIGTMNTSDRSVGHIDYAIRRRFAFVDVLPDIEPIRAAGIDKFKTVCELFIEDYNTVDWSNPKFKPSKHISSEFKPEDVMIGHSYFITKEKDEDGKALDEIKQIELKLKYEIVPILKEYIKDGILKQSKEIETLISSL